MSASFEAMADARLLRGLLIAIPLAMLLWWALLWALGALTGDAQ
jgi:hypothetical protein